MTLEHYGGWGAEREIMGGIDVGHVKERESGRQGGEEREGVGWGYERERAGGRGVGV